jgi:CspA family cold shock protein
VRNVFRIGPHDPSTGFVNRYNAVHWNDMTKSTGSVKFFNAAKGFGFIAPEDGGKDVFVPAASISSSGIVRLKAGQRVSFELEPDAKGPKAVKIVVLEEPPADMPAPPSQPSPQQSYQPAPAKQPPAKKFIQVYSDSATANDAVEDVLDALTAAGESPQLIEVAAATRDELMQLSLLLREGEQSLVKRYDPLFLALQLDDRFISESDFWTGIVEHPSLVNGPVVVGGGKARICKSAADVDAFLRGGSLAAANSNSPGKSKGISDRMAALMRGESLPPRPVPVEVAIRPQPKPAPEAKKPEAQNVEAKKAPAKVAEAKPVKKAVATPEKKAVKKAAPKKKK